MRVTLLTLMALSVGALGAHDKRSETADARAGSLRRAISTEVRALADEGSWAGEFYYGDGLGVNVTLMLAPGAGFLFEWHGCLGLYDRNWGAVTTTGDRLILMPELPNDREGFQGIRRELIPVRWGRRLYLVASDEVPRFCNAVNSGSEPRNGVHGAFLLRRGDEARKATGPPELPREFEHCLLPAPIEARIIAVGRSEVKAGIANTRFRITPLTLDVGDAEGVWVGMEFRLVSPRGRYEAAEVKRVGDHSAEAEIQEFGGDDSPPAVGWHFTTGPIH